MQSLMLKEKVAIVTGSSRGIGREIAKVFSQEGAKIAINYSTSEKEARSLLKDIENEGGKAVTVQADVSKKPEVERMVEKVLEQFGRVDVLVNNAGIHYAMDLFEITEEMWDQTLDVNLKGAYLCSKAVAPTMLQQKSGRIINISSNSGMYHPSAMKFAEYVASKAGMNGLTKALALRLGPYITVNAVCPGAIMTEMTAFRDSDANRALIEETPLKRLGEPRDVAYAALFLASDMASFITGELMMVTGGRGMHQ
jgi:3-oxoacyl-[acyl-carrier protein] reductase